jgi:hypothetical protein
MKNIPTFDEFLNEHKSQINEGDLFDVFPGMEQEVIYKALSKRVPAVGKKNKIKWTDESGFDRVACFIVRDIISNDLVIYDTYPGESFNAKDARTNIFKKGFGNVKISKYWVNGKLNSSKLPDDIVKLITDMGLQP